MSTETQGTPLERWVEDTAGGDEWFYCALYDVQVAAANFLAAVDDAQHGVFDPRLPDELRKALDVVAEFEVIVPTPQ